MTRRACYRWRRGLKRAQELSAAVWRVLFCAPPNIHTHNSGRASW